MLSHLYVSRGVDRGPALKRSHMSTSTICPGRLFQLQSPVHSATILVVLASS